jgi:CBS-domain-containing membrane protein
MAGEVRLPAEKEHRMQVIDIMTATVRTARTSTPIDTALKVLAEHRVSSLPVVDDDGAVVGIVSERDLLRRAIDRTSSRRHPGQPTDQPGVEPPTRVGEVMTPSPHTVTPDSDVADAAHVFSMMSWKAMPVVRDRRLVGVISRSDIVRALTRDDSAIRRDLEHLCVTAGYPGWRVHVSDGVVEIAGARDAQERDEATRLARSVVGVRRVRHTAGDPPPGASAG